jgi:hypothetical protein
LTDQPQRCGMAGTSEAWQALITFRESVNGRQG